MESRPENGEVVYPAQAAQGSLGGDHRLHLHHGNLLEKMATLVADHGPYDLISLSNIADWMNEAQLTAMLGQARAALASGGSVLARTRGQPSFGWVGW